MQLNLWRVSGPAPVVLVLAALVLAAQLCASAQLAPAVESAVVSPDGAQLRPGDVLIVRGLGRATVPLDGPWAFHPGDNSAWASPAFDDSMWTRIETGRD